VYVPNAGSQNVTIIGGSTNTVVATVAAGNIPRGIVFNPQNNRVYVSNYSSDNITVIDGNLNAVIATIPVGDVPTAMFHNPSGNSIYCSNVGAPGPNTPSACTISIVDAGSNTVVKTLTTGDEPTAFCYSPVNKKIYWVNEWSHSVSIVRATNDSLLKVISLGSGLVQPVDMCYNSVNERIYTANRLTYDLTVIKDTQLVTGITPMPVNGSPLVFFPNPSSGVVNLSRKAMVRLYSLVGELLYASPGPVNQLDITFLPAGMYLLQTERGMIRLIRL
jgi:YVTN family beta-propeller protein